ncbi:MAG: hypothetical protein ACYDEY_07960 [Acidimicrobiales bacterium]
MNWTIGLQADGHGDLTPAYLQWAELTTDAYRAGILVPGHLLAGRVYEIMRTHRRGLGPTDKTYLEQPTDAWW